VELEAVSAPQRTALGGAPSDPPAQAVEDVGVERGLFDAPAFALVRPVHGLKCSGAIDDAAGNLPHAVVVGGLLVEVDCPKAPSVAGEQAYALLVQKLGRHDDVICEQMVLSDVGRPQADRHVEQPTRAVW